RSASQTRSTESANSETAGFIMESPAAAGRYGPAARKVRRSVADRAHDGLAILLGLLPDFLGRLLPDLASRLLEGCLVFLRKRREQLAALLLELDYRRLVVLTLDIGLDGFFLHLRRRILDDLLDVGRQRIERLLRH